MTVEHLYISPEHNYFGHHGQPAGQSPVIELDEASLVAGKGIEGDRFFGWKEDYKGQITFFSHEVYKDLCASLGVTDTPPSVFRRNVIVSGVDLNDCEALDLHGCDEAFANVDYDALGNDLHDDDQHDDDN